MGQNIFIIIEEQSQHIECIYIYIYIYNKMSLIPIKFIQAYKIQQDKYTCKFDFNFN